MISKGEALSEPRASLSPGFPSRVLVILSTRCAAPSSRRFLLPMGRRCIARIPKEGGMIYPLIFF